MDKKWWGWGIEGKSYDLTNKPDFYPFLEKELGDKLNLEIKPVPFEEIKLPEIRIENELIEKLALIVGENNISTGKFERLMHTYGKSYKDLIRIRKGQIDSCPDVIVFPRNDSDVKEIINLANKNGIKIIPFGGGSSVVGGVEAGKNDKTISLDLTKNMTELVNLDKDSHLATFQAGVMGPELENVLNAQGYTLSHFPQSFEFSALGGWIASKSAGQQSTKYGKIEKLVKSLKMVSPFGEIETRKVPASATGPDLNQVITGSEGIFGVITEVTVKIHPLPEANDYRGYLFGSFEEGKRFIREMVQKREIFPATVRLSDETETKFLFKLSEKSHSFIKNKVNSLVKSYLKEFKHFSFDNAAILLLGFEGNKEKVEFELNEIEELIIDYHAMSLGNTVGYKWYKSRFELPYLRDCLLDKCILVDTLETATTWSNLERLYKGVQKGLKAGIEETGVKGLVACHISHVYAEGASLYYTFAAKQNQSNEIEQWQIIKNSASDAISVFGGTISHHHGVGYEHSKWLPAEIGKTGVEIIKGIKEKLDPNNIMCPRNIL